MNEQTPKPVVVIQPLRVSFQCSLIVESEAEAIALYEEITIFLKGIQPSVIVSANVFKMLSPCCGEKKL